MRFILGVLWRRLRRDVVDEEVDRLIEAKGARVRPGMERIDEALRERAARRRRERDQALESVRRQFDNPRPKLHLVRASD